MENIICFRGGDTYHDPFLTVSSRGDVLMRGTYHMGTLNKLIVEEQSPMVIAAPAYSPSRNITGHEIKIIHPVQENLFVSEHTL